LETTQLYFDVVRDVYFCNQVGQRPQKKAFFSQFHTYRGVKNGKIKRIDGKAIFASWFKKENISSQKSHSVKLFQYAHIKSESSIWPSDVNFWKKKSLTLEIGEKVEFLLMGAKNLSEKFCFVINKLFPHIFISPI